MQENRTTSNVPEKCPCGNGFYCDTFFEGKRCCKLCSPAYKELGETPEERMKNLKLLWGTGFKRGSSYIRNESEQK